MPSEKRRKIRVYLQFSFFGFLCIAYLYPGINAMVGMTMLRHNHSETIAEVMDIMRGTRRTPKRAYFRYIIDGLP